MWKHDPKEVKDLFEVLAKMGEELREMEHEYIPGPAKKLKKQNDMYESKILIPISRITYYFVNNRSNSTPATDTYSLDFN
jgi:hypothetical protein